MTLIGPFGLVNDVADIIEGGDSVCGWWVERICMSPWGSGGVYVVVNKTNVRMKLRVSDRRVDIVGETPSVAMEGD